MKYSPSEQHVLALLPSGPATISTSELAKAHYTKRHGPRFKRQAMAYLLRELKRKIKTNGEPFRLCSSKREGPHEQYHWIEGKHR